MPQFVFAESITAVMIENCDGFLFRSKLNDEWTMIGLCNNIHGYMKNTLIINSIQIHRQNTSEEISVAGILKISQRLEKKFSLIIKKGSRAIPIVSDLNQEITLGDLIYGVVYINEKQPTSLENLESKDNIQMMSFEQLSKDFEHLLDPQLSSFSDVNLKCGSACIPAHKNILCARSPVFAAMFAHPTKESLKNEVDITDMDVSVLHALLMYMYTGKTTDLTASSAADLLVAADKYQLLDLKTACSYFLKKTVCPESVWKILVLGNMHDENLKSFAADYICHMCGELSVLKSSEEWKALRKERPDLAIDLLESFVKYKEEIVKIKTENSR